MLRLRPSDPRVWGYVVAGGDTRAVYYARWTPGHLERGAQLLICLGEWGDGARRETRRAVGLECRMGLAVPSFMVIDASTLPWSDEMFGRMLSRDEAMRSDASEEAFRIVDALWEREPPFSRIPPHALRCLRRLVHLRRCGACETMSPG